MSRLSLLGGQGGSHPRAGRTGARRRSARRRRGRSTTRLGGNRGREHARPPYVSKDWREISAQGGRWGPAVGLPTEAEARETRGRARSGCGEWPRACLPRCARPGRQECSGRALGHLAVSSRAQPAACHLLRRAGKA